METPLAVQQIKVAETTVKAQIAANLDKEPRMGRNDWIVLLLLGYVTFGTDLFALINPYGPWADYFLKFSLFIAAAVSNQLKRMGGTTIQDVIDKK